MKTPKSDKSSQQSELINDQAQQADSSEAKNGEQIKKVKTPISKLSIVAIMLTVALGGFIYLHGHKQAVAQKQLITQLESEISELKSSLKQEIGQELKTHVANAVEQQNQQFESLKNSVNQKVIDSQQTQQQFITSINESLQITEQSLSNLNERLAAMSTSDNNVWLISQANYLVNLAGRKIWNDQDYVTARLLLKSADASLAQANDPSLLPARQAINQDITALAKISYTDFDGIVMTLMSLSDVVTDLPLVDHYQNIDLNMMQYDETAAVDDQQTVPLEAENTDSTLNALSNWSNNLWHNTKFFLEKFVQVEKYDNFGECVANAGENNQQLEKCQVYKALITPEQSLYLRENIRLRLFIAAQAVPRHQQLIYQQALNDVATWAIAYFNSHDANVKAFLDEVDELQQQSISNQNVPQQLASAKELSTLMQTRVRALLIN